MPTVYVGYWTRETSSTTGTGPYSLLGAVAPWWTFMAAVTHQGGGSGSLITYVADDGVNKEAGIGTITDGSPDTLARTTITASTNGGAAVNWGAGTRNIFSSFLATGQALTVNNLSDLASIPTALQNLGRLPTGQTGGTDNKVVRIASANTWQDASNADTIDQLVGLAFKVGGHYYPPGSWITGLSGLTAGTVYYLSTGGSLTSTAPTPSGSLRRVVIGKAYDTTKLLFDPMTPIGG